ncbi:plasma protease C1 inhibitor [Trichomycterus rosablanca]|uniref:plasma protease C1 inhibitor n=1 Tax=Trichomycterus rosablanca TaxID=2290929 RepID=UPI002F35220F
MLRCFVLLLIFGFSSCSEKILLPVGSAVRLPCLSVYPDGALSVEYSWWFSSYQNQDYAEHLAPLNKSGSELSLGSVRISDSGTYECLADVSTGVERTRLKIPFFVTVRENPPPLMWLIIEESEEKQVTLPCKPPNPPTRNTPNLNSARVRWFKQTGGSYQEIKPFKRTTNTEKKNNQVPAGRFHWGPGPEKLNWFLEISELRVKDEGMYKCEVTMGSKTTTTLVELKVEKAPLPRCFNQSHAWEACPADEKSSAQNVVRESLTAFSVNLYRTLTTIQTSSNLLFSPISIASLLSQLLLGSRAETRADVESFLSLPVGFSCTHSVMKKLKDETKDSILIANQMFYNPVLTINQAFINQSQEFYDSVPEKLTNSSEANVKMINDWVAAKTQNRITELVESMDNSAEFILLNAVYFIGKWTGTFKVQDGMFTTLTGDLVIVPTLYNPEFNLAVKYQPQLKATVARFPLVGKSSLYILVPNSEGEEALARVDAQLTESSVVKLVKEMEGVAPDSSEVTLPKVKLLLNTDLIALFRKMGLSQLFVDPNLCGMFQQEEPVFLTDARHRAFMSLTEKGVEASAASSVSFSRTFSSFSAMQPFVFMVWSDQIRAPIFMGRVLHPLKMD